MIQFGRGLQHQRHNELVSDNKDLIERPKLKIAHDFLFQMVDIYTHSIYYKFEDELCESLNYRFELMRDDVNYHVYKIYRRNVNNFKVREIHYDKSLDYTTCTCKKFENSGILCRHMIAYLNKYHDLDKLPTKYIIKRWTKTAKSSGDVDDNGVALKDDNPYLLLRSQLIQHSLDLIDRALTNEEATNVLKECLGNVNEKVNQIIGKNDSMGNNQMECGGNSVSKSVNMPSTYEHSYIEPNQVQAKGCGKRLKGGKERALGKIKNPKGRQCHGCGKVGVPHDKRNCPVLNNW